ncbi:MAG: spore germination protein [Oscillospiraceae bacterium]|nr:spore germination protein [Oscillospiraceae bacterium]
MSSPVGKENPNPMTGINVSLEENILYIKGEFGSSADIVIKRMTAGGTDTAFICLDGMCGSLQMINGVINPVIRGSGSADNAPNTLFNRLCGEVIPFNDAKRLLFLEEAVESIINGFLIMLVDGVSECAAYSVQDFPKYPVSEPTTEVQERGAKEGFVDFYKDNVTLIRRRLKSPSLRVELLTAGASSNTTLALCYMADRTPEKLLEDVKSRLSKVTLDIVSGAGMIQPFLEPETLSLFTGVGITERPDTLCSKLAEGKVCVFIDGTPHAIIVPYLFIENFHSLDDYLNRPYYSSFMRIIKLASFFIGVFLPGAYVAVGVFHPEMYPTNMLYDIAVAQSKTPFPILMEAVLIQFIYEIVREAGLRMPKAVGQAVSIVSALVIGDAAVRAGLIAAPMLIIVALTAITSAVIPYLHLPISVLRIFFIAAGGFFGLFGIMLGAAILLINMASVSPFGVSYLSPLSPFDMGAVRDSFIRAGWRRLGKRRANANKFYGSE